MPENPRSPRIRPTRRGFLAGVGATAAAMAVPGLAHATTQTATVVAEEYVDSRTLDLTIGSPALGTQVKTRLLLPPGWSPGPQDTWPVLYLLHGGGGNYQDWTTYTDVAELTDGKDVLVVMPDGGLVGLYSDWWNFGQGGPPKWQTFHLTELRQILESGYGAGTTRAIAGLSMGGLGTLKYAATHQGMFQAAAAYSGAVHTLGLGSPLKIQAIITANGQNPLAPWGDPTLQQSIWRANNPYNQAAGLLGIPLFMSCGNGQPGPLDPPGTPPDPLLEPWALEMNTAVINRLTSLGADLTTDLYGPGTHSWPYWERAVHRSFSMLMDALGVQA
jgi:diacylglycerol O-acyltransferase / trehalose O-mycolyltransferase